MADNEEYFGSPDRIALARRSASLWRLLRNDPRYARLLLSEMFKS